MSRSRTDARCLAARSRALAALGLGLWLAGCSDVYFDRRETVALDGGDAAAANTVTQVVDPWPPNSGNKNIGFNGQKMQSAVQRYRTNTVIPPMNATTSDVEVPPAAGFSGGPGGAGGPSGGSQTAGSPATTASSQ